MQIVVVLSFVVTMTMVQLLFDGSVGMPSAPAGVCLSAVTVYLLIAAAISRVRTATGLAVLTPHGGFPARAARRHALLGMGGQVWLIAGLAAVQYLGWLHWVLSENHLGRVPLAGVLAAWLPFPLALGLEWAMDYPFHAALRRLSANRIAASGGVPRPIWTLGQYLEFNARHHLLFVAVPVCLIIAVNDTLRLYALPLLPEPTASAVFVGGTFLTAGTVFLFVPALLVRIWRTRRLADTPLRQAIEALCRRLKIRYRELLVWETGGVVANAGVMGLIPSVRYVLLSDALLENLQDAALLGVVAHEAGHVRHRHILYSLIFALSSVILCSFVADLLARALSLPDWTLQVLALALLAGTWAVGFGWISRRFERQCDVTAAWALGTPEAGTDPLRVTPEGAATFAYSLQRIADLNGMGSNAFNWRHGSIAWRASHVLWLGGAGRSRRDIDRTVGRIKLALWAALALSVALLAYDVAANGMT